jgi:hypothetical protein
MANVPELPDLDKTAFRLVLPPSVKVWMATLSVEDRAMLDLYARAVVDSIFVGIKSTYREWGGVRPDTKYGREFGKQTAVYLFHNQTANVYKIGLSGNIESRVRSVVSRMPYPYRNINGGEHLIRIVAAIPYPVEELHQREKEWHEFFGEYRIRKTEWFTLSPQAVETFKVAAIAAGWQAEGEETPGDADP